MASISSFSPTRRPASFSPSPYVLTLLFLIPWLWPFTSGPSPNVLPLLAAWACLLLAGCMLAFTPNPQTLIQQALPQSWFIAASVSSVIGIAQWFGASPDSALVSHASVGEAFGNLRQRNQFASLTTLGLVSILWSRGDRRPALWVAAVILLGAANALSASRTGLLQWLVIAGLAAGWPGRRLKRLALCAAGLAAYLAAASVLPQVLWYLQGVEAPNVFGRMTADIGCSSRKILWSNVMDLIALKPWTGWGVGELDYAHYATLYDGARFCDVLDNAHNLPLHLAVEFGVPLTVAVCSAILWWGWRARPWAEADASRQAAWAALAVIALHSMLEYPLWYGPFQLSLILAVCLLWRAPGLAPPARRALGILAGALIVAIPFVGTEYEQVSQAYKPEAQRRPEMRIDPIGSAGTPLIFGTQLRFAALSTTPLSLSSASRLNELARELLHYSPEPKVIEMLIESAVVLGRHEEAAWHAARYKAAFPDAYAQWSGMAGPLSVTAR